MAFATSHSCSAVLLILIIISFANPAAAFGAGYTARGSNIQGVNYRHGDILMNVYFLQHVHSTFVRQIYFGNWLRDFSQLIDRKAIELVPEPVLRAVVAIFAHIQFGYSTGEFEVTPERLGCYRPEEHIDNPKGYEGALEGRHKQLRLQVLPEEIAVESNTGMKNYVANQEFTGVNDTSLDYIEKQLVAAVACGRARDPEAYTHLGSALHTLEDFVAHSNWLELCIQMLGSQMGEGLPESAAMKNVFTFTGGAANVRTHRGLAAPLVTGTFGALDLYQTLLGEVDDKITALSLPGLQLRMKGPQDPASGVGKALISLLAGLGTSDFTDDITSISKSATQTPADWGKLNEAPHLLWEQIYPIFRIRDKIVRWVYDHLTVDAVANAIASISTALDKLVYKTIGLFLGPVLQNIHKALAQQSEQLLLRDQEVRLQTGESSIFDSASKATDPTHSQLCKDHYNHELNELAGRVATKITTFTIKKIVELWQPGSLVEVKPALSSILATLHHPFNYSKDTEIQALMVAEVLEWCTSKHKESPTLFASLLKRLDRPSMAAKLGEEAEQVAHSHVPAFTAAYTAPNQIGGTTVHDIVTVGLTGPRASFVEKISKNIEKSIQAGKLKGFTMEDMAGIKKTMEATPSSEAPNPIDESLLRIPGANLLSVFDDIDIGEIVSAPGAGLILKDAVIRMRLSDTEMVNREQLAAREKLGSLEDRPVKEMLELLDFGSRKEAEKVEAHEDRPVEESKTRKLLNKLHIGKGYDSVKERS
ncbi:hypothetical protein LTR64_002204 [Lithohypha guttulata]|uniref:Uncharacterized protein n=1 Tax=Lithohypha guttulata TaxID=1690604 RepID=A0AAN7YCV4_9EURO|nr:hypothetical protein LTR51_001570 [Lithohypha guttulata]KAK5080985.1 hypothetical protein LTR05_008302 [Lithohypha guttulata]